MRDARYKLKVYLFKRYDVVLQKLTYDISINIVTGSPIYGFLKITVTDVGITGHR